jgi:mannose-6-phosphate isomerase-like protein (cupin superfamily)
MKFKHIDNIEGTVVKHDDRYIVKDNTVLNNLVVSSTRLFPSKSTSGHKHEGQEEGYMFLEGHGTMDLDDETFPVTAGDTVLIKDGVFHRVHSDTVELYFVCIFDGGRTV